jgi:hypothetical protein
MTPADLDRVNLVDVQQVAEPRRQVIEHADDPISGGCMRRGQHRCPQSLRLRCRLVDCGIEDGTR